MKLNKDYMTVLREGTRIDKQMLKKENEAGIIIFVCILLALFILLFASTAQAQLAPAIDMHRIMMIESGGNSDAVNKSSNAIGLFQITKICMDDFNMLNRNNRCEVEEIIGGHKQTCYLNYDVADLFNININYEIANWYINTRIPQLLRHYGHDDTVTNRLISYNCGISCVGKRLPRETRNYIKKYFK